MTNNSGERVTVVLRLTSPKVDLPAASEPFVLEPRRRTTQLLQVGTRATGTFPIQVEVLTPDRREAIAEGEIRLSSTAVNRVALALTGGAAGMLLNRVGQTRSELDSFRRAVGNDIQPTGGGNYDRDLRVAESSDWRPAAARARGRGFIAAVRNGIRSVYRRIQVGTTPVTLTSRRGTIPVTIANDSERAGHRRPAAHLAQGRPAGGQRPVRARARAQDDPAPAGRDAGHRHLPHPGRRAHPRRRGEDRRRRDPADLHRLQPGRPRPDRGAAGVLLLWWRFGRRRRAGTER